MDEEDEDETAPEAEAAPEEEVLLEGGVEAASVHETTRQVSSDEEFVPSEEWPLSPTRRPRSPPVTVHETLQISSDDEFVALEEWSQSPARRRRPSPVSTPARRRKALSRSAPHPSAAASRPVRKRAATRVSQAAAAQAAAVSVSLCLSNIPIPSHLPPLGAAGKKLWCLAQCRMSSNKHHRGADGRRTWANMVTRRKEEGRTFAKRFADNSIPAVTFSHVVALCNKRGATEQTYFNVRTNKDSQMVTEIQDFVDSIPEDGTVEAVILIRCVDGLTVKEEYFATFVRLIAPKQCRVVFHLVEINADTYHPRLRPFRGLGAVLEFSSQELWSYYADKVDDPMVARLQEMLDSCSETRAFRREGIQDRNDLPQDANFILRVDHANPPT